MHTLTVHTIQPLNDTTDTFMYDDAFKTVALLMLNLLLIKNGFII